MAEAATPRNNCCIATGQASMCHPRESEDPAVGHDEATSGEAAESGESKPCSVVVFWMLAFASMTHVRKARPVFDCPANRVLIHLLLGVALEADEDLAR